MIDGLDDDNVKDLILNIATLENLPDEFDKDILLGSINKVKVEILKQKKDYLKKKIEKAVTLDEETAKDIKEYTEILRELGGKDGK